MEITARGKVRTDEKGRYYLEVKPEGYWAWELARFGPDVSVTVSVKKWYKKRSLRQNSFYWGYFLQFEIDCFKEFWGELYDKKEVHEWNKQNFFGDVKAIEATGEIVRKPGSSAVLSTEKFELKLEDIRQWFRLNFEWEIPMPNEDLNLPFKQ